MAKAVGSCPFELAGTKQVSGGAQRGQVKVPVILLKFLRFDPTGPGHRHGGRCFGESHVAKTHSAVSTVSGGTTWCLGPRRRLWSTFSTTRTTLH